MQLSCDKSLANIQSCARSGCQYKLGIVIDDHDIASHTDLRPTSIILPIIVSCLPQEGKCRTYLSSTFNSRFEVGSTIVQGIDLRPSTVLLDDKTAYST